MKFINKISAKNRLKKWGIFLRELKPNKESRILDVGFANLEFSPNDNFLEKNYPYPEMITALGVDKSEIFQEKYPLVNVIKYDGLKMPFENKSFDIVWSNAVLEHVKNQVMFLKEINRVGRHAFITTPNRWFWAEIHTNILFLHYLPKRCFDFFLRLFNKKWATGDYMNLLSGRQIKKKLNDAGIKDYKIIKNKFCGFTLNYIIII